MDVLAFSKPSSPFLVGLQLELISVHILVVFHIPDKRLIFLLESLHPQLPI